MILEWSERCRRDLPWRRTRDPWLVLVSELMLQQTQVARVVPRYEAFVARFPHPVDCAAAEVGEIVRSWAGLGYNRRAVNLHRAAVMITDDLGGVFPDDLDGLQRLPGVGPYTARAILAFAYERDVGVVDTNAARVLARLAGRCLDRTEVQRQADAAVPVGQGWAWNQAVLDLGATICTSRNPGCGRCPAATGCEWHRRGAPDPDPARGTAGTSRGQSRFEGSDRQGRGRLIDGLRREGSLQPDDLARHAGWPDDASRAAAAMASLVRDGLAVEHADGSVSLP